MYTRIRLPAAWCGVVGMKPSYGSISRRGVISYASSLDTVGILANSVPCVQSVFDALKNKRGEKEQEQHYDIEEIGDATSSSHYHCVKNSSSSSSSSANIEQKENHVVESLSNIRIGIPEAFVIEECHPQIMKAWEQAIHNLECKHNATIQIISQKKISQTNVKLSLPAYYVISSAEASSNLARYDGMKFGSKTKKMEDCGDMNSDKDNETDLAAREKQISLNRGSLFGAEVKRRILAGTAVLSSDRFHSFYEGASRVRAAITSQLNQAFRKNKKKMTTSDDNNDDDGVDFMIVPTALAHPPSLSSSDAHSMDNTEIFLNDVMTTPVSLAGLPSVSIPIWDDCSEQEQGIHTRSHPVSGIQIVGPKNSEEELLRVSSILQSGLST
jgi:aspartyl-tRNA(Asn)/glutamyl-tRNA(Gln) amidotransferase subunit A